MPQTQDTTLAVDIFTKAHEFDRADKLRAVDLFPYFKPLAGQDGNEVIVNGKRMLMMCSNDYLGMVTFAEMAHELKPADLHEVSWDLVYRTNMHHAFKLSG